MSKNLKRFHLNKFKIGMTSSQTCLILYIRYKINNQIGIDIKLNSQEKFQFTIFEMTWRSSTLKVPNLLANAQRVRRKWIFQKIMCLLKKYLNQMIFMCRDILYLTVHRQLCESGPTHADVRCATAGGKPL